MDNNAIFTTTRELTYSQIKETLKQYQQRPRVAHSRNETVPRFILDLSNFVKEHTGNQNKLSEQEKTQLIALLRKDFTLPDESISEQDISKKQIISELKQALNLNELVYIHDEKTVKPYKLLGRGCYGEVYLAIWKEQFVALKQLTAKNKGSFESFYNELKLQAYIPKHENIVEVVAFSKDYFLMKCFSNGDLFENLGKITLQQKLNIVNGCAKGLSHLYKKIIHLDIKPENILLDQNYNPKIADFGLSMLACDVLKAVVGTPIHMAPEIYGNSLEKKISIIEADKYSFGITVWEIWQGRTVDSHDFGLPSDDSTMFMQQIYLKKIEPRMLYYNDNVLGEIAAGLVKYEPEARMSLDLICKKINHYNGRRQLLEQLHPPKTKLSALNAWLETFFQQATKCEYLERLEKQIELLTEFNKRLTSESGEYYAAFFDLWRQKYPKPSFRMNRLYDLYQNVKCESGEFAEVEDKTIKLSLTSLHKKQKELQNDHSGEAELLAKIIKLSYLFALLGNSLSQSSKFKFDVGILQKDPHYNSLFQRGEIKQRLELLVKLCGVVNEPALQKIDKKNQQKAEKNNHPNKFFSKWFKKEKTARKVVDEQKPDSVGKKFH